MNLIYIFQISCQIDYYTHFASKFKKNAFFNQLICQIAKKIVIL